MMDAKGLVEFTGITRPNAVVQAGQALRMAEGLVDAYTRGRHMRLSLIHISEPTRPY